jgi:uncharacterized protein YukE
MAPDPGAGGDYAEWTWAQIQAAILAGVPQTLHDAGTAFDDTRLNLDDVAGKSKNDTDDLTGPGGSWQGPASVTFTGVMNELIDNVKSHVVSLKPYKKALDDAGDALADAQTDVRNAMTGAGQDTIDRYNDDVTAYNAAVGAGTGPYPAAPGPAPYVDDGAGGQTVDVAHYPEIEAALNEKMRGIITTLAGKYQTSQAQATEPDQTPPPDPQDVAPPDLVDDVTDLDLPADGAAPPPPEEIAPIAPGTGNLSLVTKPGGLADLPLNPGGAPPDLATLDFAADVPSPLATGLTDVPGAGFGGVLGDRPLVANDLIAPPTSPDGTIGGPTVGNPLLGAAPVGFSALSGLTPPTSSRSVRQNLTTPGAENLFGPGGLPSSGTLGRELGTGGIPPMPVGGGYGMVSAGTEMESGMFLEDVFAEEELGRGREKSLVAGPEEEAGVPLIADPYGPVDEEKERENEYSTTGDDMWGTTASHPGY